MATRKGVKIPTARKLPSGNWFVQLRINGESIPITEPTEREAIAKAMAIKDGIIKHKKITNADRPLTEAIDLWIADNEHRLSPATVRGYVSCKKNGFKKLMRMSCGMITEKVAAAAINEECKLFSAKTVVNRWGFIGQVLEWATGERITPMLPQVVTNPTEFLDQEELDTFLDYIEGKPVEITALLAISSLRRSEIAALDWDNGDIDLKYGWIHVRGAVVPGKDHKMVKKNENKNETSRRDVPIIEPLHRALSAVENKSGRVVPQHPATMLSRINAACRGAGVPEVGCHGLRHSFVSLCQILKMPPIAIMEIGGWKDRATMDKIYTHVSKKTKEKYSNQFTDHFKDRKQKKEDQNANEIANGEKKCSRAARGMTIF